VLAIAASLATVARPCQAEGSPEAARERVAEHIRLVRGASCLDKERLVAHVNMWLEAGPPSDDVRVDVIGDTTNPQLIAFDIRRGARVRHRSFRAAPKSCDDLHAVLGLAIALAIDAERLQQLWLAPPEFERRWLGELLLSGASGVPLDAALGGQIGLEIAWTPWLYTRFELLTLVSRDNAISGSSGRFDTLIAAGSLQVCAGGEIDPRLRLAICAGGAAGMLHAWGTGYAPNDASTGAWLGTRAGVRFELKFAMPWLLDVEVVSNALAPSFYARGQRGELTRRSNASGLMLSVGPGWVF
jgi:hypothetical protein